MKIILGFILLILCIPAISQNTDFLIKDPAYSFNCFNQEYTVKFEIDYNGELTPFDSIYYQIFISPDSILTFEDKKLIDSTLIIFRSDYITPSVRVPILGPIINQYSGKNYFVVKLSKSKGELNTENNTAFIEADIKDKNIDLYFDTVYFKQSNFIIGGKVDVIVDIDNKNSFSKSCDIGYELFFSKDSILDENDFFSINTVPNKITPGSNFIILKIDSSNFRRTGYKEINYADNIKVIPIEVIEFGPDIKIDSLVLDQEIVPDTSMLNCHFTISNPDTLDAQLYYVVNLKGGTFSKSDYITLKPGENRKVHFYFENWRYHIFIHQPGDYTIEVRLKSLNPEKNTNNNSVETAIKIIPSNVILEIESAALNKEKFASGSPVIITTVYNNKGTDILQAKYLYYISNDSIISDDDLIIVGEDVKLSKGERREMDKLLSFDSPPGKYFVFSAIVKTIGTIGTKTNYNIISSTFIPVEILPSDYNYTLLYGTLFSDTLEPLVSYFNNIKAIKRGESFYNSFSSKYFIAQDGAEFSGDSTEVFIWDLRRSYVATNDTFYFPYKICFPNLKEGKYKLIEYIYLRKENKTYYQEYTSEQVKNIYSVYFKKRSLKTHVIDTSATLSSLKDSLKISFKYNFSANQKYDPQFLFFLSEDTINDQWSNDYYLGSIESSFGNSPDSNIPLEKNTIEVNQIFTGSTFQLSEGSIDNHHYNYVIVQVSESQTYPPGNYTNKYIKIKKSSTTLNTVDKSSTDYIFLYPNPVQNKLYILSSSKTENAVIFSMDGTKVLYKEIHENTLDIEELPKGMYYLRVLTSGSVKTLKFVKI